MSDDKEREDDHLGDLWANYEQQCLQQIESEPDFEAQLQSERDLANQKVWYMFQNSASSIAQLYKDRLQGVPLWLPFQTAAGTVTTLYKESADAVRRVSDCGVQTGYQRRTKDIINWVRKKRRNIRREELIAYLAGKLPPPRSHHRGAPRTRMVLDCSGLMHAMPDPSASSLSSNQPGATLDDNLHTFREALTHSGRRRSSPHHVSDLSAFISSEFARHCKRPAPSSPTPDVNMDSPTHKRSRFT